MRIIFVTICCLLLVSCNGSRVDEIYQIQNNNGKYVNQYGPSKNMIQGIKKRNISAVAKKKKLFKTVFNNNSHRYGYIKDQNSNKIRNALGKSAQEPIRITPKSFANVAPPSSIINPKNYKGLGSQDIIIDYSKIKAGDSTRVSDLNARQVPSGIATSVGQFMVFNAGCKEYTKPDIKIHVQPSNGKAWVKSLFVVVKNGKCKGYRLPATIVYYKSYIGFKGSDSFVVFGRNLTGDSNKSSSQGQIRVIVK